MNIILKGLYGNNKTINPDLRGRTFIIAELKAGVVLSDSGVFITLNDSKFIKYLEGYFKNES